MNEITVIAKNKPGEVATIAALLADRGINIEDIDANSTGETGVIQLVVDDYDEALRALRDGGFQALTQDSIILRIVDKPGALAKVAARFHTANINVRSLHIMKRHEGACLVSLVTEDNAAAVALVRDLLVRQETGA